VDRVAVVPVHRSDAYYVAIQDMGRRVRERRKALGLTQEDLAERTGLSRNQIQNVENGRSGRWDPDTGRPRSANARFDTVFALAEALGLTFTIGEVSAPES